MTTNNMGNKILEQTETRLNYLKSRLAEAGDDIEKKQKAWEDCFKPMLTVRAIDQLEYVNSCAQDILSKIKLN